MVHEMIDFRGRRSPKEDGYLPGDSDLLIFIIEKHIPSEKRTERMNYLLAYRNEVGSADLTDEDFKEVAQRAGMPHSEFMNRWRQENIKPKPLRRQDIGFCFPDGPPSNDAA